MSFSYPPLIACLLRYARKNIPAYYTVHFILIAGYTALQLSHLLRYFEDG